MFGLSTSRPVATAMLFIAVSLLGLFSWSRMAVELMPVLGGNSLFVSFYQPGGDPEVLQRSMIEPFNNKVRQLAGVRKTWGRIAGNQATYHVAFEPGTNIKIRELELRTIAGDIVRKLQQGSDESRQQGGNQGSSIGVWAQDNALLGKFVLSVQVIGGDNGNTLREWVERQIKPELESVADVSQVLVFGGAPKEVSIKVNQARATALGVSLADITARMEREVTGLRYVGAASYKTQRFSVVFDGEPQSLSALGNIQLMPDRPVLLRHVAEISLTHSPVDSVSRVNGKKVVTLAVFQDPQSNLVELGNRLTKKIQRLSAQTHSSAIEIQIGFDAAETVENHLDHLKKLALTGFLIALLVLWLFLKHIRTVLVVAIAIPVSLLVTGAMLYLSGYTLNLITLFGLAIGIGMLVDNSIVVFEAIQRQLEHGVSPEEAAIGGVQRTVRAIITASLTNAVVFLPLIFIDEVPISARELLANIVPAILYPLAASLLVALGLVPTLARYLAVPGVKAQLSFYRSSDHQSADHQSTDNQSTGHQSNSTQRALTLIQGVQALFSAMLKTGFRRPVSWSLGLVLSIVLTFAVALPALLVNTLHRQPAQAEEVRVTVEMPENSALDSTKLVFSQLENAVLARQGIDKVESHFNAQQGSITVHLNQDTVQESSRGNASWVRQQLVNALGQRNDVKMTFASTVNGQSDGSLDQNPEIVITGPKMSQLHTLGLKVQAELRAVDYVESRGFVSRFGLGQVDIEAQQNAFYQYGLTLSDVFSPLQLLGTEGTELTTRFSLPNGEQVPIKLYRDTHSNTHLLGVLGNLQVQNAQGALNMSEFMMLSKTPSTLPVTFRNGNREVRVAYQLTDDAPGTGEQRQALEQNIRDRVNSIALPPGYNIEIADDTEHRDWFNVVAWPLVFLLFAVLAVSFESVALPLLILLSLPLTALGALWALFFAGLGIDIMVIVGVVVLLGLTVNPAVLLVDRMLQLSRSGFYSAGSAAFRAAKERSRAVIMTTTTSIVALAPLAVVSGKAFEVWPPFATVVIGGLLTSALLTLLVIPVGFVALKKWQSVLQTLGNLRLALWFALSCLLLLGFYFTGLLDSVVWQFGLGIPVVALVLLGVIWFQPSNGNRDKVARPSNASPQIEARFLSKVYGRPGPFGLAMRKILNVSGTTSYQYSDDLVMQHYLRNGIVVLGLIYGAITSSGLFWQWVCLGGVLVVVFSTLRMLGWVKANQQRRWLGSIKRQLLVFFKLNKEIEHCSLRNAQFSFSTGMIGLLGPNGAGKTTLFRLLTNLAEPTLGTIRYQGVDMRHMASSLSAKIGFLPQEFGLPKQLTGREYLSYFALQYQVNLRLASLNSRQKRDEQIDRLLSDTGLTDKQHEFIGAYSGGMRQRLAIARTLLHNPEIIIVDEPTIGLDPSERIKLRNLLKQLSLTRTVLFSTHVVEDIAVACDRVVVLKQGDIVFDDAPDKLALHARGKVWEWLCMTQELAGITEQYRVLSQVNDPTGKVRVKVLSNHCPHSNAELSSHSVEDGYMQILYGEDLDDEVKR